MNRQWSLCPSSSVCLFSRPDVRSFDSHSSIEIDACRADFAGKVFVDLGSGVGQVSPPLPPTPAHDTYASQVCMMIAALADVSRCYAFCRIIIVCLISCAHSCSCFGIEIMENPAQSAVQLLSRFKLAANAHGISYAPIQLQRGDFLKSSEVKVALSSAGIVYMNNPKFGPELNSKVLGEQFCQMICLVFSNTLHMILQNNFAHYCRKVANWYFPPQFYFTFLCLTMQQVCFDSLIGTRGYWNFCMRYVTSFDCGKGSVSWNGNSVRLHVLEKL